MIPHFRSSNTDLANIKDDISELNSNFDGSIEFFDAHPSRFANKILSENKIHLIGLNYLDRLSVKCDDEPLGCIPLTNANNYFIRKFTFGTNPSNGKRALVVMWYADGIEYTSYFDQDYQIV